MSNENPDQVIDEAFAVIAANIIAYVDVAGVIEDEDAGIRMSIEELSIETPIELDVRVTADGAVIIGCAPPIYPVERTIEPVLHTLRIRAAARLAEH